MMIYRLFILPVIILFVIAWVAKADDMDAMLRKHYFDAAKRATTRETVNDDRIVNCCGEGDAVKVKIIGQGPGGLIIAQIIDIMKSANGKVGDVIPVPPGKVTVKLYSPFAEPILFINGANMPYCLSFSSGG